MIKFGFSSKVFKINEVGIQCSALLCHIAIYEGEAVSKRISYTHTHTRDILEKRMESKVVKTHNTQSAYVPNYLYIEMK